MIIISVELLHTLSFVSYILGIIMVLLAVALFFLFRIPKVIGDVSGSTARKMIENIRQQNEQSGDKAYKPSPINQARGRVTDKISPSGRLGVQKNNIGVNMGTSKIETMLLNTEYETGQTTLLSYDEQTSTDFSVEVDIGFCESTEVIE